MNIEQLKSIVGVLADYVDNDENISLDRQLRDIGLDSLDIAEIEMELIERLRISFTDEEEITIQKMTVKELIDLVDTKLVEKENEAVI